MAHFAEVDSNNKVLRVVVACNEEVNNYGGDQSEMAANRFAKTVNLSFNGIKWIQTSYNNNFRKRFAAVDGYFIDDSGEGYFTTAKQFSDWVLNTADGAYYQPLAVPSTLTFAADSKTYKYTIEWDQSNTRWLAYEVHGEVGAYYRSRVNNNDVDDLTEEAISSPTSAQLAAKVWNTSSSAWE